MDGMAQGAMSACQEMQRRWAALPLFARRTKVTIAGAPFDSHVAAGVVAHKFPPEPESYEGVSDASKAVASGSCDEWDTQTHDTEDCSLPTQSETAKAQSSLADGTGDVLLATAGSSPEPDMIDDYALRAAIEIDGAAMVLEAASSTKMRVWRCSFPGCSSRMLFTRACDLRKHHRRHSNRFYCRVAGCPRSASDSHRWFASEKDRSRHEAKHNPHIRCSWTGGICARLFSRLDNMKDHVRRVHGEAGG